MSYTRSHLGALVLGLCWAFACSQKDPNDGLNDTNDTTDTDESDTTEDTSDETTSTASSDDTTTDIESDTTSSPGQTTSESDESDATETTQADASAPDDSDTSDSTDSDTADSDTSDSDTADSDTSDSDTTESDGTSDTSDSDTSDDLDTQICPMAAGASWTYKHSDWTEVQTVTATEYEDEAGFVVKDTPDPEDNLRADTVLIKRDGRLVRVYKEQYWVNPNNDVETLDSKATYGVGFVRCDEAWATKEVGWSETPAYIRVETVGEDPPKHPRNAAIRSPWKNARTSAPPTARRTPIA